jgi:two-component system response regulator YesN
MPKVLVVDDERIFRKGLARMITGMNGEWQVVGEACDGYDALDQILQHEPDFLLTDIRMPGMDGLQLQQIVREQFPHIQSIVLSGYDDFGYVQHSLRMGAKDYLTKPIDREELEAALMRLKTKWLEEKKHRHQELYENKQMKSRISRHILMNALQGNIQIEELRLLEKAGIRLNEGRFYCVIIKLDRESINNERYRRAEPSLFQLYIQQFVQETIDAEMKGYAFVLSDAEVAAILNTGHEDNAIEEVIQLCEEIRKRIRRLSSLTITIGIGTPSQDWHHLCHSYNEAQIALLHRLIQGGDRVFYYGRLHEQRMIGEKRIKIAWKEIEQYVHEGRTEDTRKSVQAMISELCSSAENPETIQQQVCKLMIQFYELAASLSIEKEWLEYKDIRTILFELCSISSRSELIETCQNRLGKLSGIIGKKNMRVETDPIVKAMEFIEKNYNKHITLNMAAEQVFLNPAYFSSLFKSRTGKTFIEYLTGIRLDEARKLILHTNDKIHVIADRTGFINIRHFNRVFKNEMKMTPKQYKELNAKRE